ncbi:recombinase family protein [Hymenobacter cavernae]|nr:recombinase family protein [Hymenobacter cavernae]
MRVAIYARVSTKNKGQDTENQLHQLRESAEHHGII